jgi:hypothetical protein
VSFISVMSLTLGVSHVSIVFALSFIAKLSLKAK